MVIDFTKQRRIMFPVHQRVYVEKVSFFNTLGTQISEDLTQPTYLRWSVEDLILVIPCLTC